MLIRKIVWIISVIISGLFTLYEGKAVRQESNQIKEKQNIVDGMLQNFSEPQFVVDDHRNITQWDAGMERLTGIAAFQAKNLHFSQMLSNIDVPKDHVDNLHKFFQAVEQSSKLVVIHCNLKKSGGGEIPVLISIRVLYSGDRLYAVMAVGERSQVEQVSLN